MKPLENMTNEELWELFPIILTNYDPEWPKLFSGESAKLKALLGNDLLRIRHIGSTAVPGLTAKPTIDILIEIHGDSSIQSITDIMENAGYICSPQPDNPPPHLMFLKGYTPEGFRGQAYHVHLRYMGDWDEVWFRDYLISHPDTADEYASLKTGLMQKYRHDRDAYTSAKSDFIKRITALARHCANSKV